MPPYTHNFHLIVGDEDVTGKIEFNLDGQASFVLDEGQAWTNLTLDQSHRINALFQAMRNVFMEFGSITKIEVELD